MKKLIYLLFLLFNCSIWYSAPIFATVLNTTVYNLALTANTKLKQQNLIHNTNIIIVDFTLPSSVKRLWIVDSTTGLVILNTYVAHGTNSGNLYASHFSNNFNSHQSSIGVYVTTTIHYGKHGAAMQLQGLEPGYNTNAAQRLIEIHGVSYIGNGQTGRSWGCFAVPLNIVSEVVTLSSNQAEVFAYYPDQTWLNTSSYLH